jgi:quercetin dioxygenase-like cupin family protein
MLPAVPAPARVVHLDQLDSIPGPGTLTWRPVRVALDVRAFGCNAYTAAEAGRDVVEPHTESAHQELYFVAAGRATFTIDGERHDAPAGTFVFVPDPASHRHALAAEPHTTVLTFGGPPTFEPSAWEWGFRSAPLMRSDPERARAILEEGLSLHPRAGSLHYNLACLEAREGNRAAALTALRRAVELQPEAAEWARSDEDLASLRSEPDFRELL